MSQAKHTPGPWWHAHDDFIHNALRYEVCAGTPENPDPLGTGFSEPDARLAAAAPDLLAALEELVALKAMKDGITTVAQIEEYERRKPVAWDAARAAVAKAKGDTHVDSE